MHLSAPNLAPVQRTATLFRLLMVGLATLAAVLSHQPIHAGALWVGAAYVAAIGALWLLAPNLRWWGLIYPIVALDVAVVTSTIVLLPPTPLPLWVLYVFALAGATVAGGPPAAVAAGLSIAGYVGTTILATGTMPTPALWPIAALLVSTFLMISISSRWLVERHRKRAWQEIAASLRTLSTRRGGVEETTTMLVESTRRLLRAERAWLWWCGEDYQLRQGPQAGRSSQPPTPCPIVTPGLAWKLRRGPIPLSALHESLARTCGEVIALRTERGPIALLAAAWIQPPSSLARAREQLRILAPSAAGLLSDARGFAELGERLRREEVLREAAAELASTLDRQAIQRALVGAARSGLTAAVSLVERSTGHVLGGDAQVTEALVRLTADVGSAGTDAGELLPSRQATATPLSVMIDEKLALIAWREEPPLDESDANWLSQLAPIVRRALERCAIHEGLMAEERRLRAGLNSMPAPFALWDADGSLILANSSLQELAELAPTVPIELSPGEMHEQEVILGNPLRTFVAITTRTAEGDHLVTVYREITRERDALRAKDELIAMAGHELRTPLTSIAGYSQLMARQLGVIQQQVGQLNGLIGDFVDAARREDGRLSIERQALDMRDLAKRAAERFRGSRPEHALRLILGDVLPIEGDPGRLGQVLDNLLENAAKYSPPEQEIVLSVGTDGMQVTVSVQDHGVGILPEHLPLLFERFYRVPGAKADSVKGLGLGLAIVRDLVTAHGGRVWAESPGPGRGSTFWISLPVSAAGEGSRRLRVVNSG